MNGKLINEMLVPDLISICENDTNSCEQAMLASIRIIDSLTNQQESLALYRLCSLLPEGAKVLEIGSFNGASAAAMGHALKKKNGLLYCIDPWSNYIGQDDFARMEVGRIGDDRKIINNFMQNTEFLGADVKMMRGTLADFAGMVSGQNFDLIFIDGAHDYLSVKHDILVCLGALKPGGLLCGHDYHTMGHGVRKAVDELIGSIYSVRTKGTIAGTFIWFARIDNPGYLQELVEISNLSDSGNLIAAFDMAVKALREYKTEELIEVTSILKTRIFLMNQNVLNGTMVESPKYLDEMN